MSGDIHEGFIMQGLQHTHRYVMLKACKLIKKHRFRFVNHVIMLNPKLHLSTVPNTASSVKLHSR